MGIFDFFKKRQLVTPNGQQFFTDENSSTRQAQEITATGLGSSFALEGQAKGAELAYEPTSVPPWDRPFQHHSQHFATQTAGKNPVPPSTAVHTNSTPPATNELSKEGIGNGEETLLGYGFSSSYNLSHRGYRDGVQVQTLSDMQEGIQLILAEYQAYLDLVIQKLEDEKDICLRVLARSGSISQQFDEQYEELIHSLQRKISKYEGYRLEIPQQQGQAAAIVTAYKRGYQAGVGKHPLYLRNRNH